MAFQIIKISNFLWKTPPDPLVAHPIGAAMIHGCLKNIPILHTQKKGWTVCSITNEGYPQTNLGTCDLFPVAMMSLTSVASIPLETLINT